MTDYNQPSTGLSDFLSFRTMITPIIIQVLFWVGTVLCVIAALITLASGGLEGVLGGFLMLILGPIFVRIYCEILILAFRINQTLTEIKHNTENRHTTSV